MPRLHVIPQPNKVVFTGGSLRLPLGSSASELACRRNDPALKTEEYRLAVTRDTIQIDASAPQGFFRAEQTLHQMERSYKNFLPCVRIEDRPRFGYRGFLLDSARHFQTTEEIKRLIDAAAYFKFNYFHWHLSDDQGWRVQIDAYPELTGIGSVRCRSAFGGVIDPNPYGGFYSKDDIRDIVSYCEERYITVIPEIDLPGHVSSVLVAFPELSCTGNAVQVKQTQGIFKDILCAGKDEVFTFVKTVLTEMADLFPGPYFHIGGDEAPKARWRACTYCQERMKAEGLRNEEQLQGYFTNRVAQFLQDLGKTPVVWNESLKSGCLNKEIIALHWMDTKPRTDSAQWVNEGGRMINGDFFHYYTDYEYHRIPLKKTYQYEPVLKGIAPSALPGVLGVETMIWTEHVRDMNRLSYMTFPRFAAVAETGWTMPVYKNEKEFETVFRLLTPRLKELGIYPANPEEWNPLKIIDWDSLGTPIMGVFQATLKKIREKP